MRMNETETAYVNALLERGATVEITADAVISRLGSGTNTQNRVANTRTFETPTRAAHAVCENLAGA